MERREERREEQDRAQRKGRERGEEQGRRRWDVRGGGGANWVKWRSLNTPYLDMIVVATDASSSPRSWDLWVCVFAMQLCPYKIGKCPASWEHFWA